MTIENANRHVELSRRMIRQAHYELEYLGDRLQASDKASGAVAHAVKAIAEDRQWRHSSHNLRRQIVGLLADEFDRPNLVSLQYIADALHNNFYEDLMHPLELRRDLAEVTDRLEFLWEVRERGPNPDFIPSPEQQQAIDRLSLTEEEVAAIPLIDYPPPLPPFVPPEQ